MMRTKRVIDFLLSLGGGIVFIPLVPIIGLLIKLDSRGPLFYRADRVGKDFKLFKMYKFRTMAETPIKVGDSVCPQYDPRVTPFGHFLRRTKLNELPQLINVLKGEMTFVGPRPEAPDLADLYPEKARRVFSVKPGLVGPATILGRNEEEMYPPGVDAKRYYIEHILPPKNKVDLEYIDNPSLFKDFIYILKGVKETLMGAISKRHIHDNRPQIYLLISDLFLITYSYLFASFSSSWLLLRPSGFPYTLMVLPFIFLIRLPCNIHFGMYSSLIRYISIHEIRGAVKAITYGSVLLILISSLFGSSRYSGFVALLDWACLIILLCGFRFALRLYWDMTHRAPIHKQRILIYGVCDEGNAACRALTSEKYLPYEIIGFIDDDPNKYGKIINGKKVLGNRYHIKALSQLYRIEEIIIAEPGINSDKLNEIKTICQESDQKCRILNSLDDFYILGSHSIPSRPMDFSDFLSLRRIHAEHGEVRKILVGKTVLVNAPTGALGLELCRRVLQLGCEKIIIVDRYESYLNELVASLLNTFPRESIVPALIESEELVPLEKIFAQYGPHLVFHAGMRKYESFLGVDLGDLSRTNYLRTFLLAKMAAKFQCELFILISSLLAGGGGNILTDSLRIAELSLEHFFSDTQTRLVITRLCDIAENRGGIVSIIEERIRNREKVILPLARAQTWMISRYSAAEFILQSLVEAKRSLFATKVFFCDPGPPIPLIEVTERIANHYRLRIGSDVKVEYSGQISRAYSPSLQESASPGHIDSWNIDNFNGGRRVERESVKSAFRDFVLLDNNQLTLHDWTTRSRELMKFCRGDFSAGRT